MQYDKDFYLSAQLFIKQHGDEAEEVALAKMHGFMERDDVTAASAWLCIAQAIKNLQDELPSKAVH